MASVAWKLAMMLTMGDRTPAVSQVAGLDGLVAALAPPRLHRALQRQRVGVEGVAGEGVEVHRRAGSVHTHGEVKALSRGGRGGSGGRGRRSPQARLSMWTSWTRKGTTCWPCSQ